MTLCVVLRWLWHVFKLANLQNETHANREVPFKMTMCQPKAGIISAESQTNEAFVGHQHSVSVNWTFVEFPIFRYSVLSDFSRVCDIHVERTHLHDVELEPVQVKGMSQAVLDVNQDQIDNRVQFHFYPMNAMTEFGVRETSSLQLVVGITEHLLVDFLRLSEKCEIRHFDANVVDDTDVVQRLIERR